MGDERSLNATSVPPKLCPTCGVRYAADALFCPNDGTPLSSAGSAGEGRLSEPPDLYLGRELSGHIEIRQLAGIGAMGRVYRAFQKGIERDVAVKILHRELSANPQLVARFHREAKVASRLSHPNVVQVHLAGQLPDGALFIVMEYLDGLSLQSALAAAGGYMPLPRALHIALQICDAAGEAHSQGVVHRDLKPENVMLVRRGEDVDYVKVLDFGIARLNWGDQSMATAAGLIFGTARYISPEGAQGEAVGPQGDVYAIATLLYQMLGGRTPFEGDQAVALLVQQIHDPAPSLKSIPRAADVPDAIAAVIMKNLSKRAQDRSPDARVLGRLLIEAAKASGLSPEELVPRSMLLGSRSGPMHLPPVQRTKQLDLPAELSARLAASDATPPIRTARIEATAAPKIPPAVGMAAMTGSTAPIAIAPSNAGPPPHPASVASALRPEPAPSATTKWTPPPDLAARLLPSKPGEEGRVPRKRVDSNVDDTMDDDDAPPKPAAVPPLAVAPAPLPPAPARVRTQFSEPLFAPSAPLAPRATPGAPPVFSAGFPAPPPERPLPGRAGSQRVPSAASSSGKPASTVESTLSEDDGPLAEGDAHSSPDGRRARSRAVVILVFCFILGAIVAAAVLFRIGILGPTAQAATLDAHISRADEAMRHKRWDTPPGNNVRDITDEGLAQWPRDPRLLDIRERAADELVKEAVGRKFEGDMGEALHLAHLANELDPTDTTAQHLVAEYESEKTPPANPPTVNAADASVAPPHGVGGSTHANPPIVQPPSPLGQSPLTAAKVNIDALPPRPRLGQPVAFSAKVTTASGAVPKLIEDVHFKLNGPGLATDTRLSPVLDVPGTYRVAFTFFEPGKYELSFEARVDGILTRTQKPLIAGDEPSTSGGAPTLPPPSPSGKWL